MPSLYGQTLIKAEFDYQREIRRKLDQIEHDNRDVVRRRMTSDYLFAHEHLSKRYQWYQNDKSYRDACRLMWKKELEPPVRKSHIYFPAIQSTRPDSQQKPSQEEHLSDDIKIKRKFLQNQPVMLEVLKAPHSSEVLHRRNQIEKRKKSAFRRFKHIQSNCTDDKRYQQLVQTLNEHESQ